MLKKPILGDLRTAALFSVLLLPIIASAHHSSAHYAYSSEYTELTGELTSVAWANPHIGFSLKTTNSAGREAMWELELPGSVYSHERRGIRRELFQLGDRITVAGHVSGRVEGRFLATNVLLGDGREIIVRERAGRRWDTQLFAAGPTLTEEALTQRARVENRGLFRVWSQPLEGDAREVGELPFRDEAIAARRTWDPLNNFVTRCELPGMPDLMDSPYPIEFVDRGSWIELRAIGNYNLGSRRIHTLGTTIAQQQPGPLGVSVGRWEGLTFVVETNQINWPYFDNRGTPQGNGATIVERFTLSEDQSRLDYQMTVTDLEVFARPAVIAKDETYAALGETMPERLGCER